LNQGEGHWVFLQMVGNDPGKTKIWQSKYNKQFSKTGTRKKIQGGALSKKRKTRR
jgi:hypothetical protein